MAQVGSRAKATGPADSAGCLRQIIVSLPLRKGASVGAVFCSGNAVWATTTLAAPNAVRSEAERQVCCASQTVKVTVNAAANPVHPLLRSWVDLGVSKCTDRP